MACNVMGSAVHVAVWTQMQICFQPSSFHCTSKATLPTFSIVMCMVQAFCVRLIKFDCALAPGADIRICVPRLLFFLLLRLCCLLLLFTNIAFLIAVISVSGSKILTEEHPAFLLSTRASACVMVLGKALLTCFTYVCIVFPFPLRQCL